MSRPDSESETGGFLGRWAKRKQDVQKQDVQKQEALKPLPPAQQTDLPAQLDETAPAKAEEELPLPSLDSIVPGGDVSAFFQKHVPEALRTAALRKLWVTDPEIKNFIEMADYQWDFNNPDSIPGWGSSVGNFDAKKLVERIMGAEKSPPTERIAEETSHSIVEDANPELAGRQSSEADGAVSENTEFEAKSMGSEASTAAASELPIQNGAAQKNIEESIVYETARKRHGRALPS